MLFRRIKITYWFFALKKLESIYNSFFNSYKMIYYHQENDNKRKQLIVYKKLCVI